MTAEQCFTCYRNQPVLNHCLYPQHRNTGACPKYKRGKADPVAPDGAIPPESTHSQLASGTESQPDSNMLKRTWFVRPDQAKWIHRTARSRSTDDLEVSDSAIVREALDEKMAKEGQS